MLKREAPYTLVCPLFWTLWGDGRPVLKLLPLHEPEKETFAGLSHGPDVSSTSDFVIKPVHLHIV